MMGRCPRRRAEISRAPLRSSGRIIAMPACSLAMLLSAIFFYLALILILSLSSEPPHRWRSSVLLCLSGGCFLSTFRRTIAASQHQAELSILLIYAPAAFISTRFLDSVSLYCSCSKLRHALPPAGYASSTLVLGALLRGRLISGVAAHRYVSTTESRDGGSILRARTAWAQGFC
jgi:hypothetical protein